MPPTSTDWCRTISSCCFWSSVAVDISSKPKTQSGLPGPKNIESLSVFWGNSMVSCNTSRKNNPTIRPFWSISSFAHRTSVWWFDDICTYLCCTFFYTICSTGQHMFFLSNVRVGSIPAMLHHIVSWIEKFWNCKAMPQSSPCSRNASGYWT